jgi:hypothetical protein
MFKRAGAVARSKVSADTRRFGSITAALTQGVAKRGVACAMPFPQVPEVRTFQAWKYCGQTSIN